MRHIILQLKNFIKNKRLFIFTCILFVILYILDNIGVSPKDENLDVIWEVSILITCITLIFLSIKHNIIVNSLYIFSMIASGSLICIAILQLTNLI